jgi:hypothetical protein
MCLFIKDGCNIEIAKKDIVTFKTVLERENYWEPSYIGTESYEYNKTLTARKYPHTPKDTIEHLQKGKIGNCPVIHEGFHSRVIDNVFCNKICIIPKGSEICYGDNNDIVSSHIIVFKNRSSYLKYRLAKLLKRNIE